MENYKNNNQKTKANKYGETLPGYRICNMTTLNFECPTFLLLVQQQQHLNDSRYAVAATVIVVVFAVAAVVVAVVTAITRNSSVV